MKLNFKTVLISIAFIIFAYFLSADGNWSALIPLALIIALIGLIMNRKKSNKVKKTSTKTNSGYEEVDYDGKVSKKKGGLGSYIMGGIVANKISSPKIPPTVTFENPDTVVMGIKPKGREWLVKVGKREGGRVKSLGSFTVSNYSSSGSSYGGKYTVYHNK